MRCLFITFESQHGGFLVDYWYQNRFSGSSSIKQEFPSNTYRGGPACIPLAKHPTTLIKPTLKKTLAFVSVLERPHTLDFLSFMTYSKGFFVRQVLKFLLQRFCIFSFGLKKWPGPGSQATLTKCYGKIKFGIFFLTFYKIISDHFINPFLFVELHVFNFGEIDFNDTEKLKVEHSLWKVQGLSPKIYFLFKISIL